MRENITVKPDKTRLTNLIDDINEGFYQVPIFQRDFVWKQNQMLELFDSIRRGYPIGSLLFWKPGISFKTKEQIGPYVVPPATSNALYILDGYQRVTTLFSVLSNPFKNKYWSDEKESKDFLIYYDLRNEDFAFKRGKKVSEAFLMPLYKIVDTYEFLDFLRIIEMSGETESEIKRMIDNAKKLSKILFDYEIPYVEIKGGDIKSAVEIFSRVNSTGQEISTDFMLSALNYDSDSGFLFSEEISLFLNSLTVYNFDDLKRDTILNCIASSKGKVYFDIRIEELKFGLESITRRAFEHIELAVEFLYYHVNVVNSKLLPYPTQLIFLSEFFRVNPHPSNDQIDLLTKWFWITSYSNYFTIYSLSQQRSAYKEFMDFAYGRSKNNGVFLLDDAPFEVASFPKKLNFTSVRSKVLQLFFLKQISNFERTKNETIIEQLIVGDKDKSPGNIILRFGSDFETDPLNKPLEEFFKNSDPETLAKHFIDVNTLQYLQNDRINEFIEMRERYIMSAEGDFVRSLQIDYLLDKHF